MAGNTFGRLLKLTTFGESHGPAIGGVLDGCPAGIELAEAEIQKELDLRKPGAGAASTSRKEADAVRILSGVFNGKTTGTPIAFYIANENQRSHDYGNLAEIFRPGHADWTYFKKYKGIRDYRGGGRASGRETAARVAAGAVAKKILKLACNGEIQAACLELGGIACPAEGIDLNNAASRPFFAASDGMEKAWLEAIDMARKAHDTLGGIVLIEARNIPPGLGEPVFEKLDAMLAMALMSVGAVKGVEFGSGFQAAKMRGSLNNDPLFPATGENRLAVFGSNNAGGILGGISTGQDIVMRVAVKPIASISQLQQTINIAGEAASITIGGRHDLSAIPRIVPVLGAMAALALADALLLQKRMEFSE